MPSFAPTICARRAGPSGGRGSQRLAIVVLSVLLGAMVLAQAERLAHRDGSFYAGSEQPVGGDFLVFYTAGRLLATGAGNKLYDPARQLEEQQQILGRDRGLAIFPYPAFAAIPYALLAPTALAIAYVLATLAMAAAAIAASLLLRRHFAISRAQFALVLLTILSSQPFAAALFGGQPVAITLLCFAGVFVGMRQQRPVAAGIWLGLLSYKPQLAAPLVLALACNGQWRLLAAAAGVGAALVALAMAWAGVDWPLSFWRLLSSSYYRDNAILVDGIRSISVPTLLGYFAAKPRLCIVLLGAAVELSLLAGLLLMWRRLDVRAEQFPLQFAAAIVVTLLVSPHALFYETALLVLPMLAVADCWYRKQRQRQLAAIIVVVFALGYTWPLAPILGFEPLAVLPPLVGLLIWRELADCKHAGPAQGGQPRCLTALTEPASNYAASSAPSSLAK